MHGGSIDASSAGPGRGSTFTLRLPICELLAPSDVAAAPGMNGSAAHRRVVVIDDNADAGQMLALLIRTMGGEAWTATNGSSGIRLARTFLPDLILLDIGMPGLDGYETCRRIRQESFGRSVCIVALTGWGQDQDKQRASDAGFDLHLTKPADPLVLERLIVGDQRAGERRAWS
jgi:CheY-like chemotaxis protein